MTVTQRIFAAASLALLFASGIAGAAPHPQGSRAAGSGYEGLVDAASQVHIDKHASPKARSGVI